jgi:CheY-like chemotaxis protein
MRPLSILLADDEATVRQLVTICLERKSFVVLPPSSGEEALQMARSRHESDLLLTDVQGAATSTVSSLQYESWKRNRASVCW